MLCSEFYAVLCCAGQYSAVRCGAVQGVDNRTETGKKEKRMKIENCNQGCFKNKQRKGWQLSSSVFLPFPRLRKKTKDNNSYP
jgi:hypothetical protein